MPMRTVRRRRIVSPEPTRRPRLVWPRWTAGRLPPRALLALLPLGCVLLGGTTEGWSQAVMLLALGGVLAVLPPRRSLGWGMNLALGGLFLFSLTAFLPADWFFQPTWRAAMGEDFGVALPGTLSPQPWLTAESVVVFAAGLSWFYLMGTVRWADEERRRAAGLFAGGVVALAVAAVGLYRAGVHPALWPSVRGFGPFPNRNQTADFFAVGALPTLACARAAWREGRKGAALAWMLGWLAVVVAVFHSFSRAGMLLLFATTAVYLGIETFHRTRHHRVTGMARWRRLAMVASLALVLGSGLLIFGGETLARLRAGSTMTEGNTMSNALRLSIYRDTAAMIAQSPWCGTGVNTFNEIFPTYRRLAIQNAQRVKHPESDWLWLTAELGWPGLLAMLAGVGLLARLVRPPRHGHDRPLRLAATVGLAGFLAHSLVDVSAHRVGSVFAALFLVGLALPGRGATAKAAEDGRVDPLEGATWTGWMFRGLGGVFIVVGLGWLAEAGGLLRLPGDQGVERWKAEALEQSADRDFAGAYRSLTQALAWSPLDWRAYYMRGAAGAYGKRALEATQADFQRVRYLEGVNAALPLDEARVWATVGQMPSAVNALLEACRRDPANAANFIRPVYALARRDPDFIDLLAAAIQRDPALIVPALQATEPPDSAELIADVRRDDPGLGRLDDAQKRMFFEMWTLRGDARSLASGMEAFPAWQSLGWRNWAEACAQVQAFDQACRIVQTHAAKPKLPAGSAVAGGEEGGGKPPLSVEPTAADEPGDALKRYQAQMAAGDKAAALTTVQRMTTQPGCPAYFYYLEASLETEAEHWNVGWAAWQKYLAAVP